MPQLPQPLRKLRQRLFARGALPEQAPSLDDLLQRPLEQGEVSLAELLAALHPAEERERRALAKRYVSAVTTATRECLAVQGHLFESDPEKRRQTLGKLAETLFWTGSGFWRRFGIEHAAVEAIGLPLLDALVRAVASGLPTLSLEVRAYDYLDAADKDPSPGATATPLPRLRQSRARDAAARRA